jgi:transaldolase
MSMKLPKVFLDSGDPEETKKAKGLLGHLEGQTTNPSLVIKNPQVQKLIGNKKLTEKELLGIYKDIIHEIAKEIAGSISIEVYADWNTTASQMLAQAEEMNTWINHAHIKFPTTPEGLKAAHEFATKGGRVNMTLVFTQAQAAATFAATLTPESGEQKIHFVSPFIGRWDDRGFSGLDLVKNIHRMYRDYNKQLHHSKSHVEILAASIRTLDHLYASIFLGADILTIPLKTIHLWMEDQRWMPDEHYRVNHAGLKSIVYNKLPFHKNYEEYKVEKVDEDLLDEGLKKFAADWNSLLK